MEKKRTKKWNKALAIVFAVVVFLVAFFFTYGEISMACAHKWKPWRPDYEKRDITAAVQNPQKTEEDYRLIYEQTGLTKIGVDGLIAAGKTKKIYEIQKGYFQESPLERENVGFYACLEEIDFLMPHCELEAGDILVSNSTHVMNFRLGHAALVLNKFGNILEGLRPGENSDITGISVFMQMSSFMILRPKLPKEVRASVAKYAENHLTGVEYSLFTGIFTKKASIKKTQCAHIVWYSYYKFGYDFDSNGGLVVTPGEIANSPELDVVQIYGYHPEKLWK
ncbi:MAG: hypothetical protein IIX01_03800 [Clostridia bacterium]|nr:hypothetical protein [Clostridia bacterium]